MKAPKGFDGIWSNSLTDSTNRKPDIEAGYSDREKFINL